MVKFILIGNTLYFSNAYFQSKALHAASISVLEKELCDLLADLRIDAVNLVDAFDLHEKVLGSTIGAWDGNVYERFVILIIFWLNVINIY